MDYEKKYKNALTIAQSRFKIEKDESVLTCLGMMFPELRESEDERIRQKLIHIVKKYRSMVLDGDDKAYDDCLAYLEKRKEPTTAEWGEEDEVLRQDCIQFIETGWTDNGKSHLIPWLKSLRPQPKQEWSEADEKMRTNTILSLRYLIEESPNEDFKDGVKKEQEWLKSLHHQPSWKPSEEQMKALGASIVFHKDDPFVEKLRELYNQLQRL